MPTPDPSKRRPGLLARFAQPARDGRTRRRGAGAALLLALVTIAAAWLLTPGRQAQRFPGEEALGTPAVGNFKAARDQDIPDAEATERLREQAAGAEPAVYDFDEAAGDEGAARVRGAFAAAREALAEGRRADRARRTEPRGPAAARAAFAQRVGTPLGEESLAALAEARFAEPVAERAAALTGRALTGLVAEDRDRLLAENERGIALRAVRAGEPQAERPMRDLGPVRDARSVREEVRRDAAALPAAWPPALREAVLRLAAAQVRPTLAYNMAETARRQREAAERVKPVMVQVRRGEKIVGDGELIERRHLLLFRGIEARAGPRDLHLVRLGGGLLVALLALALWRQARRGPHGFRPSARDTAFLTVLFVGTLGLAAAGMAAGDALYDHFQVSPEACYLLVPFAAGALLARSLLSAEVALRFAVASGLAVGLLAGHSIFFAVHAVVTSVAASGLDPGTRGRGRGVIRAGLVVGLVGALSAVATQLFTGRGPGDAAAPALLAFAGGAVLLPALVSLLLPVAERALGAVGPARLQALANLNHPALKDLIVQAPGTYHHSVVMGSLVEAAAERVGAQPLLAKVCAYYHDIGKTRNPSWFHENQRAENRHDGLAPSMSALVVKRHVVDGVELAARWRLPRPVVDAIAQHHGTRFVSYFWSKARKAVEEGNPAWAEAARADETLFRYGGPRPQSREAALVMMADVIEASSRGLEEPTAERVEQLARRRVDELLAEGQLDDCPMTLRDVRAAAQAMATALAEVLRARAEARPTAEPAERPGLHLVAKS